VRDREGEHDADHGAGSLLEAARQRAVGGGVNGQKRGPRRQERLRQREHLDGE
jgi:hypothetical protein